MSVSKQVFFLVAVTIIGLIAALSVSSLNTGKIYPQAVTSRDSALASTPKSTQTSFRNIFIAPSPPLRQQDRRAAHFRDKGALCQSCFSKHNSIATYPASSEHVTGRQLRNHLKGRVTLGDLSTSPEDSSYFSIWETPVMREKMETFIDWLDDKGVQGLENVGISLQGQERGIAFQLDLPKKSKLLRVPIEIMLTDQLAPNDPFKYENMPWDVRLALKLIREKKKNQDSRFAPYIDILPSKASGNFLPVFWSPQERMMLEYPDMIVKLEAIDNNLNNAYNELLVKGKRANLPLDFTREEFHWAWEIAQSRAFAFETNLGKTYALAPLVDLFNHGCEEGLPTGGDGGSGNDPSTRANLLYPPMNTVWRVRKDKTGRIALEMRIWSDVVQTDTEALLCYGGGEGGGVSNDVLLQNYGFCSGANPSDDVSIFTSMDQLIRWYFEARPMGEGEKGADGSAPTTIQDVGRAAVDSVNRFQETLVRMNEVDKKFLEDPRNERMAVINGGEVDIRIIIAFANMERKRQGLGISTQLEDIDTTLPKKLLVLRLVDILYNDFKTPLLRDLAILAGSMFDPEKWAAELQKGEMDNSDGGERHVEMLERIHFGQLRFSMENMLNFLARVEVIPNNLGGYLKGLDADEIYEDIEPVRYGSNQWTATMYRALKKISLVEAIIGYLDNSVVGPSDAGNNARSGDDATNGDGQLF
eukprot:jgi/Bigna1/146309/aug1.112_g21017